MNGQALFVLKSNGGQSAFSWNSLKKSRHAAHRFLMKSTRRLQRAADARDFAARASRE
ncbi:hypothetical protein Bsp3421_001733 [Burkholderia sp. FERM BP-3421]|jgi:hypothetical protein|uniref:hypothetical protein n=1 Tax=Burkholderia sp. FERM BP-3421 TaxID=1494466 RepID=UPI002360033B|nr:hypothetical protein [Burkholderia sp. FERM BP-3421]WDD91784.1 hypothetical protein Bsp3421_001733 [Burkholderia sp. FERM BP-3421]